MSEKISSFGKNNQLGEGILWHPLRNRLFWFDIPKGILYSTNAFGGQQRSWNFGEPASAMGWVDQDTLLVATATGLQKFDLIGGHWETLVEVEADNPKTRSNDGRAGPGGHFWFGTMADDIKENIGSYYLFAEGKLEKLFDGVGVPNSTCFSPDGKFAYLGDTIAQIIWRWRLDERGYPVGDKQVHIDVTGTSTFPDGSVCDAEGHMWNARWGGSQLVRYSPDGEVETTIPLPVSQPTCPAFGGPGLGKIYITSAAVGLDDVARKAQPDAGKVLVLEREITGFEEFQVRL